MANVFLFTKPTACRLVSRCAARDLRSLVRHTGRGDVNAASRGSAAASSCRSAASGGSATPLLVLLVQAEDIRQAEPLLEPGVRAGLTCFAQCRVRIMCCIVGWRARMGWGARKHSHTLRTSTSRSGSSWQKSQRRAVRMVNSAGRSARRGGLSWIRNAHLVAEQKVFCTFK